MSMATAQGVTARTRLEEALAGVEGWLTIDEAEALYAAALAAPLVDGELRCLEIGSYKGRSAICLALALRDRGCPGEVVAIDPHAGEIHGEPGASRFAAFRTNLVSRGLAGRVRQVRQFSRDAVDEVADGSVSVLFIDGSHDYADVCFDIRRFVPKVTAGGTVLLNDPFHRQVAWAIRDTVHRERMPLRRPRLSTNTLILDWEPGSVRTRRAEVDRWRLRAMLPVGWRLTDALDALGGRHRRFAFAGPAAVKVAHGIVRAIVPKVRPGD